MTPKRRRGWSAPQRIVLIALLSVLLIYLVVRLIFNPQYIADPQPPVPTRAKELQDRIDPNTADASTLAALPLIGEKRAHDIVVYREQLAAEHPGQRAFTSSQDLQRIRGIGTATVAQLQPYLMFDESSHALATTQTAPPGRP